MATFEKKLLWEQHFRGDSGPVPSIRYRQSITEHGDEFTGYEWQTDHGDGSDSGAGAGWGNNEREFYTDDSINQDGSEQGSLVISARRVTKDNGPDGWQDHPEWEYLSGKLTTAGLLGFHYGYLEARIKVPTDAGSWSAFWLLGETLLSGTAWPECGEIDILEAVGQEPNSLLGTVHGPGYCGDDGPTKKIHHGEALSKDFHTYGVLWLPDRIEWYFDGDRYHTLTAEDIGSHKWVFNQPFYMIVNLAMGGNLGGALDPAVQSCSLAVDYIRHYSVKMEDSNDFVGELIRH